MTNTTKLLDRKELVKIHPALGKGHRLNWLIRCRKIPIVRIGKNIYFDLAEINRWIDEHRITIEEDINHGQK